LLLEIGHGQARRRSITCLRTLDSAASAFIDDLQGIPRVAIAQKS